MSYLISEYFNDHIVFISFKEAGHHRMREKKSRGRVAIPDFEALANSEDMDTKLLW